jgi:hypothetical protein
MIRGALILESLRPGSHLAGLRLMVREISRLEPGGTTADQPSTWSVLEFEADEAHAAQLAEAFAGALAGPGWYADFRSATETFVVFPGQVFRYPRHDPAGRAAAEAHGRLLGIPDQQLDWPA